MKQLDLIKTCPDCKNTGYVDVPARKTNGKIYYTLIAVQYGPIGESVMHEDVLRLLSQYYTRYEKDTDQHLDFAQQIIGFQMVGTYASAAQYQVARDAMGRQRRQMKKLRFRSKPR